MRTASSSVSAWRSRTQWASRWVWIEESMIWLTCAPESEKVMTVRGWRMISQSVVGVCGWR